ncbi:UNVERIFIED_CONTAM: hypothetical protein K2H54_053229 [Gekko kuhli]
MSQSQIREIEAELIKERLHEISLAMEVQGMMSDEDVNKIQIIRNFLKDNHDLQRTLEAEIQNLEILVQFYSQKQSTKETEEVNYEQEKDEVLGAPLQKKKCTL